MALGDVTDPGVPGWPDASDEFGSSAAGFDDGPDVLEDIEAEEASPPNTPGGWSRRLELLPKPTPFPVQAEGGAPRSAPAHYQEPGSVSSLLALVTNRPHLTALVAGAGAYWLAPAKHRWTAAAFGLAGGYLLAAFILRRGGSGGGA